MRAQEFITESTTVERDGITLDYQFSADKQKLKITALSNGRQLGSAKFQNYGPADRPEYKGDQVDVDERYRGQGIATVMYNLARELVGQLYPSPSQTADGERFWRGKPVWEDSVEENRNTIIDKGIGQALRDKGYKKIGHGNDQDAYIEPGTGQVLKIFGTGKWNKTRFSDDQKMFFKWYKYCMKNADNPYLPKFSGYETFEFKGKTYLQIRQERLTRDKKFATELVAYGRPFIGDNSPSNTVPPELVMTVLKSMVEKGGYKMKGWSDYENRGFTPGVAGGFERIIQRLGIDGFYKWIITCKELRHTARMNWWYWDLAEWNIMMRGQTPVILDPWYAGSTIE